MSSENPALERLLWVKVHLIQPVLATLARSEQLFIPVLGANLGYPPPGLRMYTLLSGLYRSLTQKDEFYVLILGLDGAGKTTFLEAAKDREEQKEERGRPTEQGF